MRLRGIWSRSLVVCAALAVLAGCDPDADKLREDNSRLNVIVAKQEEENQRLMLQMQEADARYQALLAELQGRDRKIEALREGMKRLHKSGVLSNKMQSQLEILASKFGGVLIGNRLQLPGDYIFASGQYQLSAQSATLISQLSDILKEEQLMLLVVGHTDNVPVRHARKRGIVDNRHLSVMRAISVIDQLKKAGYDEKLMYPTGWGELIPIASNDSAAGRAKNRRVEILIDPAASGLMGISAIYDVQGPVGEGAVSVEQ